MDKACAQVLRSTPWGTFPGWQTSGVGLLPLMTASCTSGCAVFRYWQFKSSPASAPFKEFLAPLQCLKSGLERPGLTTPRGSFGDSVLLSWSFYVQLFNCPVWIFKATNFRKYSGFCPSAQPCIHAFAICRFFTMRAEPYNPLYVWGSRLHQVRSPVLQGGASVQQGLSAAFESAAHDWHRGAADKRYSLCYQSALI